MVELDDSQLKELERFTGIELGKSARAGGVQVSTKKLVKALWAVRYFGTCPAKHASSDILTMTGCEEMPKWNSKSMTMYGWPVFFLERGVAYLPGSTTDITTASHINQTIRCQFFVQYWLGRARSYGPNINSDRDFVTALSMMNTALFLNTDSAQEIIKQLCTEAKLPEDYITIPTDKRERDKIAAQREFKSLGKTGYNFRHIFPVKTLEDGDPPFEGKAFTKESGSTWINECIDSTADNFPSLSEADVAPGQRATAVAATHTASYSNGVIVMQVTPST